MFLFFNLKFIVSTIIFYKKEDYKSKMKNTCDAISKIFVMSVDFVRIYILHYLAHAICVQLTYI